MPDHGTHSPLLRPSFVIGFGGSIALEAKMFFDDSDENEHPDATAEDCANEIKRYISENGVRRFLGDWNLEQDLVIYLDDEQVYP